MRNLIFVYVQVRIDMSFPPKNREKGQQRRLISAMKILIIYV